MKKWRKARAVKCMVKIAEIYRDDPEARLRDAYGKLLMSEDARRSLPPVLLLDYGARWRSAANIYKGAKHKMATHRYHLLDGNHRTGSAEAAGDVEIAAWVVSLRDLKAALARERYYRLPTRNYSWMDTYISCGGRAYDREGSHSC